MQREYDIMAEGYGTYLLVSYQFGERQGGACTLFQWIIYEMIVDPKPAATCPMGPQTFKINQKLPKVILMGS